MPFGLVGVYRSLFWVIGGGWKCMEHYIVRVGVGGKIFWVGEGERSLEGVGALFDNACNKITG